MSMYRYCVSIYKRKQVTREEGIKKQSESPSLNSSFIPQKAPSASPCSAVSYVVNRKLQSQKSWIKRTRVEIKLILPRTVKGPYETFFCRVYYPPDLQRTRIRHEGVLDSHQSIPISMRRI